MTKLLIPLCALVLLLTSGVGQAQERSDEAADARPGFGANGESGRIIIGRQSENSQTEHGHLESHWSKYRDGTPPYCPPFADCDPRDPMPDPGKLV